MITSAEMLAGWDYLVVSRALKALRLAGTAEKRRAILIKVEAENPPDGKRLAALAEVCFEEAARKEPA